MRFGILATVSLLVASGTARASIPESPEWTVRLDAGGEEWINATTAAADGTHFAGGLTKRSTSERDALMTAISPSGELVWTAIYGVDGIQENVVALAADRTGSRVFAVGSSVRSSPVLYEPFVLVYDARVGVLLWSYRFAGAPWFRNGFEHVVVSPDSSAVFVTGMTGARPDRRITTVALDAANGDVLWTASFGSTGGYDVSRSLTVDPAGGVVFVTGVTDVEAGHEHVTVAYAAASGEQVWMTRKPDACLSIFPQVPTGHGPFAAVSPAGDTLYVADDLCAPYPSQAEDGAWVSALDARTGETRWESIYVTPGTYTNEGVAGLVVAPDGSRIFVAARRYIPNDYDYLTVAHKSDGTLSWSATYDRGLTDYEYCGATLGVIPLYCTVWANDVPTSIAVSPDGARVFVTGGSIPNFSESHNPDTIVTEAYAADTGARLWSRTERRPSEYSSIVNVSSGGTHVYLTRVAYGAAADVEVVALPASGCAGGSSIGGGVSSVIDTIDHQAGTLSGYVQGVNCDVVAPLGL